jgi:hypothetical protein
MEKCEVGTSWGGKMKENNCVDLCNRLKIAWQDMTWIHIFFPKFIGLLKTKNPCKHAIFLLCHERLLTCKSTQDNHVDEWLHNIDNPVLLLGDWLHKIT